MKRHAAPRATAERNTEAPLVGEDILSDRSAGRVTRSATRPRADRQTRLLEKQPPTLGDERVLSFAELLERIPLHRSTIWRLVREGRFPAPIHLTRSKLGWRWSTVLAHLNEREAHPYERRDYFGHNKQRKKTSA